MPIKTELKQDDYRVTIYTEQSDKHSHIWRFNKQTSEIGATRSALDKYINDGYLPEVTKITIERI